MHDLDKLIEDYKAARDIATSHTSYLAEIEGQLETELEARRAAFRQTNHELIMATAQARRKAEEAQAALRAAAVETWQAAAKEASQNDKKTPKTLRPGLSVRVSRRPVYDAAAALEWADVNAPFLVKRTIDAKAFEKLIDSTEIPFVSFEVAVSAVISL